MSLLCSPYPPFYFVFLKEVRYDNCIVTCSGINLKSLVDAAESYQIVLAENRKLFNEVQELKGGIICVFLTCN